MFTLSSICLKEIGLDLKLFTPADFAVVVLLILFALFQLRKVTYENNYTQYEITFSNGRKQVYTYPQDSGTFFIKTDIGEVSIRITSERISVIKTNCRHQICKNTDIISSGAIVCVPGRFVISPVNNREVESDVDFIVQ